MPNRSASEREPEYQQLIAGHSLHKGVVEVIAVTPKTPREKISSPTLHPGLRERMSDLFHHLWH